MHGVYLNPTKLFRILFKQRLAIDQAAAARTQAANRRAGSRSPDVGALVWWLLRRLLRGATLGMEGLGTQWGLLEVFLGCRVAKQVQSLLL